MQFLCLEFSHCCSLLGSFEKSERKEIEMNLWTKANQRACVCLNEIAKFPVCACAWWCFVCSTINSFISTNGLVVMNAFYVLHTFIIWYLSVPHKLKSSSLIAIKSSDTQSKSYCNNNNNNKTKRNTKESNQFRIDEKRKRLLIDFVWFVCVWLPVSISSTLTTLSTRFFRLLLTVCPTSRLVIRNSNFQITNWYLVFVFCINVILCETLHKPFSVGRLFHLSLSLFLGAPHFGCYVFPLWTILLCIFLHMI